MDAVLDRLGVAGHPGGDHRQAGRHRLEDGQREALVERRQAEDVGRGVELGHAVVHHAAGELHRAAEPQAGDLGVDRRPLLAVAGDHQPGGRMAGDDGGHGLDQHRHRLAGAQPAGVEDGDRGGVAGGPLGQRERRDAVGDHRRHPAAVVALELGGGGPAGRHDGVGEPRGEPPGERQKRRP